MESLSGAPEVALGAPELPSNIPQIYHDNAIAKIIQVAQIEMQNAVSGELLFRPNKY